MNNIKDGLSKFMKLNVLLLVFMIVLRLFFFVEVHWRIEVEASQFWNVMRGVVYDFYLFCHISCWLLLPFMLAYWFFPKVSYKIYKGLMFLYVVVNALLIEYYCNLMMPMDHVVLIYSVKELLGVAASSASVTVTPFAYFIAIVVVTALLSRLWEKVEMKAWVSVAGFFVALVFCLSVNYGNVVRSEKYCDSHSDFILSVNQPSYSFLKLKDYIKDGKKEREMYASKNEDFIQASSRYQQLHPQFHYPYKDYPFYHKAADNDVIGSFFDKTDDGLPPNFVFIIMESFGQRLTGVDFPEISFTPFIDSLKTSGLYWPNCISSAERTFQVLPAVFGSAILGSKGFANMWQPVPSHNSLLKDMKKNGYDISYYYGGVNNFDRYDLFLKTNSVDYIFVPQITTVDSAMYELLSKNNRWGLDDGETFEVAKKRKDTVPCNRPYIDIYQTLTTHEPFVMPGIEKYEKRVEQALDKHPNISEKERNNVLNNKNIFGCYIYLDDCVRKLMKYYENRPEYKNTIFVITGDHRMPFLGFGNQIRKYNVPLIFVSPLLKEPRYMDALVAHVDITPTINAFLKENYDYKIENFCHWTGVSLDTSRFFESNRKIPLMFNNRDVIEYISDTCFISGNYLFSFDENLCVRQIKDEALYSKIKGELDDYNFVSKFAEHNDRLLPASNNAKQILNHSNGASTMTEADEYGTICPKVVLDQPYSGMVAEVSFDLKSLDVSRPLPSLVIEKGDYYLSVPLVSESELSLNTGAVEHYRIRVAIPMDGNCVGETLKIYLWNNNHASMEYDNVSVSVVGEE